MVAGLEEPTAGRDLRSATRTSRTPSRTSGRSTRSSRTTRCSRTWTSSRTSRSACAGAAASRREERGRGGARAGRARPAWPGASRRQLSGGQQQRVALARAIVNRPGGAAARRAARRARPQAAPADADRAQADPDRGRPHVRPRHARPGGGHDDGRHHRGHERAAGSSSWATRPSSTSRPTTTFVANFLGQSNLIRGQRRPARDGDDLVLDVARADGSSMPAARAAQRRPTTC